ncbi:MAG: hypothetical protein ACLQVI_24520 [Polyangiaceae bacterium]
MNFAELLDAWAAKYDARTVLERAIGRAAVPLCAALVAGGRDLVGVVDDAESRERMRAAYGAKADVRIAGEDADLPKADLVVVHGGARPGDWRDWRASLLELGKLASKLVVVCTRNPEAWNVEVSSLLARLPGLPPPADDASGDAGWGRTRALAPVLWEIGRVKEHAFLDVPPLGQRAPRLARRLAPSHAFVVDVTPRTPQARRRVRLETV